MIVANIHACDGCGVEGRSWPDDLPGEWDATSLLGTRVVLCELCRRILDKPECVLKELGEVLRKHADRPRVGDKVELLVDGYRGKFKGEIGIIDHGSGYSNFSIRVPGKKAPGEDREYCGPYSREQFRIVERIRRRPEVAQ